MCAHVLCAQAVSDEDSVFTYLLIRPLLLNAFCEAVKKVPLNDEKKSVEISEISERMSNGNADCILNLTLTSFSLPNS